MKIQICQNLLEDAKIEFRKTILKLFHLETPYTLKNY